MIKILFIIETLRGGGAEKVLVNLLKYLDSSEFEITVLTLFSGGINQTRLPQNIKYICRNAPYFKGITRILKWLPDCFFYNFFIKKALKETDYDIAIAYMHGLPTRVVSSFPNTKKITWIHGNMLADPNPVLRLIYPSYRQMQKSLMEFDAFVGVSETVCNSFKQYTGISDNVYLIHNTNDIEEIKKKASIANPFNTKTKIEIITVGHLMQVKGNDRLLEAISNLRQTETNFHLTILGDGNERLPLENYISDNNLSEYVSLPGFIDNPYPYMANADIYICPSYSEGFSTAVSEAIILGLPVISTDVSGAREILGNNNEYGIVCENSTEGITQALKKMLASAELRQHYANQAKARANFFSPERTVTDVEKLIKKIINC